MKKIDTKSDDIYSDPNYLIIFYYLREFQGFIFL